jgi:hypothetical protein
VCLEHPGLVHGHAVFLPKNETEYGVLRMDQVRGEPISNIALDIGAFVLSYRCAKRCRFVTRTQSRWSIRN